MTLKIIPDNVLRLGRGGLAVSGGGGFSPKQFTDLLLWLDASSIAGLSDGDAVGTWSDLSGNGYHATEADAARPTYKTNVLNGKPVVRFDGANNFMQLLTSNAMPLNDNTVTIFVVYQTTSAARQMLFASSNGGSLCLEILTLSGERTVSTPGVYVARTATITHVADTDPQLLTYRRSGDGAGTHSFYTNGMLEPLTLDGAGAFSTTAVKQLGRRAAGTLPFAGDMAEIIIYGSSLSDTDRRTVESYLCSKYGLVNEGAALFDGLFALAAVSDTHTQSLVAPLTWVANTANKIFPPVSLLVSGDVVSDATVAAEWTTMNDGLALLDTANTPYIIGIGNHEYDSAVTVSPDRAMTYRDAAGNLPQTRYTGKSWWSGGFEGATSENAYYLFSSGGLDWIILTLEFGPRQAIVDWANTILTTYADRKSIVLTHGYLGPTGARYSGGEPYNPHGITGDNHPNVHDGEELWTECLKLHANVCFVLCGHDTATTPQYSQATGDNGNLVNQMLFNWHETGMAGFVRIIKFKAGTVDVYTYSPATNVYLTDAANQFSFNY